MLCLLLCLSFPASNLRAANSQVQQAVAQLERRYRAAHTLEAAFLERYSGNGQLLRGEAGTAYFRRPGKMRWEYESPEKNVFVVDGKTAWFYVPADHTVTRAPAKQSTDWRTPLALLAGEMKLSRICARIEEASAVEPAAAGNIVLHCALRGARETPSTPSSNDLQDAGQEESVYLEVVPISGELSRVLIRESGGVEIEFRFAKWRFDPPVEDSLFRFDVPRGVAIVNGEAPAESKP
jgi:outer membrane lipoprotein carrier protein